MRKNSAVRAKSGSQRRRRPNRKDSRSSAKSNNTTDHEEDQQIGWDEFFDRLEESELALPDQNTTPTGQKSNINKLVRRK
jgi:hypothetical protein